MNLAIAFFRLKHSPLTSLSPVDGRYYANTGDHLRLLFSEYGLIRHRLELEIQWLLALSEHPEIPEVPALPKEAAQRLRDLPENFTAESAQEVKDIEQETNHDVKALEYYLRKQLIADEQWAPLERFIHFACTSWDINHPAYALMLERARTKVILPAVEALEQRLETMAHEYAGQSMLARTHGQPASPTTLGKEMAIFLSRLRRQMQQLHDTRFLAKMNGAVGNYNAHLVAYPNVDWPAFSCSVLESLGLESNSYTTQIEPYDQFAEFFHVLIRINNLLTDFARDAWQYISIGYFNQRTKDSEVGSSTMPHKVNPIDFENAEGNLGLASSELMYYANKLPISRLQRDLSDSTVLRNMGMTLGNCVNAYKALARGMDKIQPNPKRMEEDLAACPEVLAEAIQTVMKCYGMPQSYEQLKAFTRGQQVTLKDLREFIAGLDDLPESARTRLLSLEPRDYIGYAEKLARNI